MDADELEQVMTDFVAGKHHVLVCTTIIESGLDIPNCNTIIIEGADRFGLAQLYQLRGRVGPVQAPGLRLPAPAPAHAAAGLARQRLAALRQHNQPGAGFRIAMRDLELRGAGNLLGAEQSGHIAGVGFELYCQLLRQSVARLKGDKTAAAVRATRQARLRLRRRGRGRRAARRGRPRGRLHRAQGRRGRAARRPSRRFGPPPARLHRRDPAAHRFLPPAGPGRPAPALCQIEADLRDRFGKFGDEVRALLLVTEIRLRAEQKGLLSVEAESNRLKCLRNSGRRDDWVMTGSRFPRLTAPRALLRLREIIRFLNHLPNP